MKSIITICLLISSVSSAYSQLWKQYADSATAYRIQKQPDRAIKFFNKAKEELQKDSASTTTYARICDSLAFLLRRNKQYNEAEQLYLMAIDIKEKLLGKNNLDYAWTCNGLGLLYRETGKPEKAEPLLLAAMQIRGKILGKENLSYGNTCGDLANVYGDLREYAKAEPLYLELGQILTKVKGKESREYGLYCSVLAQVYFNMEKYQKAEPLYLEAKEILGNVLGMEDPSYALCCMGLGNVYQAMGQFEKAEPQLLEAIQIQEKVPGKETPDYAISEANLALLYNDMGRYEKAEALFLDAKQILENGQGKESREYAGNCENLAYLYFDLGQYEKAETLFLEANQIQEKVLGKEDPDYASSCGNLGMLYGAMGQYDKAEALLLEAKQIQEKVLGKGPGYTTFCNNLAQFYFDMGQYRKAEPLYLEAKIIQEKTLGKESSDYAAYCRNLGDLYAKIGKYEKAEPLFLESKKIMGKVLGKQHPEYGYSCARLATLFGVLRQPLRADTEFKESFSANTQNLSSIFQFTNEKEKTDFIRNIFGEDENTYSFYLSSKLPSEQPYSISLFHRNLILYSSEALKRQVFSSNDTALANKYNDWVNLRKYLSVLYSRPVEERKDDAAATDEKAGQLEKELASLSPDFAKQRQKVGWKDIRANLRMDQAAIEFAFFHFYDGMRQTDSVYYVAIVLKKSALLPTMVYLCNEKQLKHLLSATGNSSTDDAVKSLYASRGLIGGGKIAANKSIYDLVWRPLEKELTGIGTVYFAPAGMLHRIAFAALPINKQEVLSDKYNLVQLASTASIPGLSSTFVTSADNLQLYGGIKYDTDSAELKQAIQSYASNTNKVQTRSIPHDLTRSGTFAFLPGTEAEVDSIETLAKTRQINIAALSRTNATEESFKALDGKASPSVIHIATHGFFFPDPKDKPANNFQSADDRNGSLFRQSDNPLFRSGLIFAGGNLAWQGHPIEGIDDGILTAYEVSNMYLPNTKLVVLSACETALGDIQGSEGVYGLQRAFKIAGVPNLIMSLWKVPDKETVEFMQEFYKNLFAGKSISNAFYQAQEVLKAKYRTDPYKWAAWVLVR